MLSAASSVWADARQDDVFSDMSLEDLAKIEVTSVSKKPESLADAAASIYIITAEDIRRAGSTSLPEALRLAPNLQVARVNGGAYAITARGFNNAIGNKLLVLIDGRTVYTPQYSGVNWDSQFVMLEDVERIEVISGPGATLWGANAVNGVINVITRSSQSTQGWLVSAGGGNEDKGLNARYGGKFGDNGTYRVYGMGFSTDNTEKSKDGSPLADGWKDGQMGFRADWGGGRDNFTVQGDAYRAKSDDGPLGPSRNSGSNVLARWTRDLGNDSAFHLQTYYDQTKRDDPLVLKDEVDTFDIEMDHSFTLSSAHKIMWGGGYRNARDEATTNFNALNPLPSVFTPGERTLRWWNIFVQDDVALAPSVDMTMGVKAENNVYTGTEYLPSVRLSWKPDAGKLLWGALSRAVRAPARLDRDFQLYLQLPKLPLIPVIKGGPDFQSEIADVAEIGYRAQPTSTISYSVTGFYSWYDKLRSGQPPPAYIQNMMYGPTYGLETWGNYQAAKNWRLSAGLLAMHEDIRIRPGSLDPTGPSALGNDPKVQFSLRSSLNLTETQELDVAVRHVGELPDPVVPSYTALDLRYGCRLTRDLELSLTGQNILGTHHPEFGKAADSSEIPFSFFAKLVWRL